MGLLESLAEGLLGADDDDDGKAVKPARAGAPAAKKPGLDLGQITKFVQAAVAMVSKIGLPKLIAMFKAAGLEKQVLSWIGAGKNEKVSGKQVEGALGSDFIGKLAKKVGIDPAQASAALATYLPKVIDALTPDGKPDDDRVKKETAGVDLGDIGDLLGSLLKK